MAGASISHALIVAGPSGAGKSTFLRALADGRLPGEIQSRLPSDAAQWPLVRCKHADDWHSLLARHGDGHLPGVAIHYDITLKWRMLAGGLERDHLWQMLERCQSATLVDIRPSEQRLLVQWLHAKYGVQSLWLAYLRRTLGAGCRHLLHALRRLRTVDRGRTPGVRHYPKAVRFLRPADRLLDRLQLKPKPSLDFYRGPGNLGRMLRTWDDIAAAKLADCAGTRIQIKPDDDAPIARDFDWRLIPTGETVTRT